VSEIGRFLAVTSLFLLPLMYHMTRSLLHLSILGLAVAGISWQDSCPGKPPPSWMSSSEEAAEVDDDEVSLMQSPSSALAQRRPVRSNASQPLQDTSSVHLGLPSHLQSSLLQSVLRAATSACETLRARSWPMIAMICLSAVLTVVLAWYCSWRARDDPRFSQHPYITGGTQKSQTLGPGATSPQPAVNDPSSPLQTPAADSGAGLPLQTPAADPSFRHPPGLVGTQAETRLAVALSALEKCDASDDPECTVEIMAVNSRRPACQMAILGGTRLDIRLPNQRSAHFSIQAPAVRGPAFNIYDCDGAPIGHLQNKSPGVSEVVLHSDSQVMIVRGQSSNLEFSVTRIGGKPIAMGKINNEDFSCPHFEVRVLPGVDAVLVTGILLALAVTTED